MNNKTIRTLMLSFCLLAVLAGGAYAQGSEYTAIYTQQNQVGEAEVAPNGGILMASGDFRFEMLNSTDAVDFYLWNKDYSRVATTNPLSADVVIFYNDNSEELKTVAEDNGKFAVRPASGKQVVFYTITVQMGQEYIGARYIVGDE